MEFDDPKYFDDPQASDDPRGIQIGSMDFDNRKVYGDTFISDGLVLFYIKSFTGIKYMIS